VLEEKGNEIDYETIEMGEEDMSIEEEGSDQEQKIFEPGNIHKHEFFDFWQKELEASPWVLNLLEKGYKIPFKSTPPTYEEQNNATARAEPDIVAKIVLQMIEEGIVDKVTVKPHCVSPLGLVKKNLEDGTVKYRLVFDASRCVNLHLEEKHVSLMHLEKALELTEKGEYQSIFDLASCYYHVKIYEAHQKFLGAAFIHEGRTIYFQYKHLPFGLASAVHVITKIMKPIISKIQSHGIKFSIYIDDGRFLAQSQDQANNFREKVYEILEKAGWQISKEKSDGKDQADRRKKYLGFVIDTTQMKVYADDQKINKLRKLIMESVEKSVIPIKHLAKILGNIIALIPSHGFVARVASKSGYGLIEKHTSEFGWKGQVFVDRSTKDEWKFLLDAMRKAMECQLSHN